MLSKLLGKLKINKPSGNGCHNCGRQVQPNAMRSCPVCHCQFCEECLVKARNPNNWEHDQTWVYVCKNDIGKKLNESPSYLIC